MTSFFQQEVFKPQPLVVGEKAPLFTGKDHDGNIFFLADKLKKGPVVVIFYPGAWCPYCNREDE